MKRFPGLAVPLLALAVFVAFGAVVLFMADVGTDIMLAVLDSVTPPTNPYP